MTVGIQLDNRQRGLLSRAQGGDISAFERLVERHRDSIYEFGLGMTRSETEAAELAQESFLSAYLHLAHFRNETDFSAWLYQIAARHALFRLRPVPIAPVTDRIPTESPFDHRSLTESAARDWSKDQDVLSAELRRAIEEATAELPQGHREALLLKDVAELSYEQVANISRSSIAAVKSRLHEARLRLRAAIDRFYREDQEARSALP